MKKTLMASLFLVPLMTSAATVRTSSAQSSISTSQESSTGVLSAQQQAQQWGLSDSDWSRYQTLMEDRGIMSPGLDPLTALGVETDNSAERRRWLNSG